MPLHYQKENVLGHRVSIEGLEVDCAKISTIEKLPPSTNEKTIKSILGHEGFCRRFIKDFQTASQSLEKDIVFHFYDDSLLVFQTIKKKLISTPILVVPNWSEAFKMYDANDYAFRAVFGQ